MKIPMKAIAPKPHMVALRNELLALVKTKMADAPADEILAVLSYTVAQLVAMQDQRRMTPGMAMELVATNIEAGNLSVLEGLANIDAGRPT